MTSDLFQNIGGQWVAANLPVPVLVKADDASANAKAGLRCSHQSQARESTIKHASHQPSGEDSRLRRVETTGDSRGGQNSFDGTTYVPELDRTRLKAQLVRVRELMRDGKKRSLAEIAAITGDPEASISARLRQLRQPKNGLWTVNRQRRSPGTFEYSLGGKGL